MLSLQEIKAGEVVTVIGFGEYDHSFKHKLLSLGVTPGTQIHVIRRAPLGCPIQVKIRGFLLSLRTREAESILVE